MSVSKDEGKRPIHDHPLIVIAAIVGAHGVRGEAKLRAFGDAANVASYGPFLDKDGKAILTPKTARSSGVKR